MHARLTVKRVYKKKVAEGRGRRLEAMPIYNYKREGERILEDCLVKSIFTSYRREADSSREDDSLPNVSWQRDFIATAIARERGTK